MEKIAYTDSEHPIDMKYLDFTKAFDEVPHQRLLMEIEPHGIGENVFRWIGAWLRDRKQRVVLRGQTLNWNRVSNGIHQGSVPGPLLFVMYNNVIDDGNVSHVLKFADDTKIG